MHGTGIIRRDGISKRDISHCRCVHSWRSRPLHATAAISGAGIYLPAPVFAHGQLYVALSRVRSAQDLRVLLEECPGQGFYPDMEDMHAAYTQNIVYQEVLRA